ncbi:MAG: secretin N-terminal domain-containing protein [Myxococcota bacterium]
MLLIPVPSAISLFRVKRSALLALWVVGWVGLSLAMPAAAVREAGQSLALNGKRMQVEDVIARVAEATQRTILFDESVRGTVSIVAKRPVTHDEAWRLLESSLSMLGFSLLPSTVDTWRIAKVASALGEAPFVRSADRDAGESFVTTLVPLRVADLQAVIGVLQPLSGSRVTLVPYAETNSLIASGPERSIARLTSIADELDRVEEREIRLRTLRYRDVSEAEPLVEALLESGQVNARDVEVWTDERTNSVVLRGTASGIARMLSFLDRFDEPTESEGQIRILRVLNRDPVDVADLIRGFARPSGGALGAGGNGGAASASAAATEASRTELDGQDYTIAVDEPSRSLIVRADPKTHEAIRNALEILDAPAQLIAVDITLTEVRTPRALSLGFGFQLPFATGVEGADLIGAVVSSPGTAGVLQESNDLTPFFGRVSRDRGITFEAPGPNGTVVTVPVAQTGAIDAGEFSGQTKVLIQPHLVITAGDRHEIFVGDNLPVPVTDNSGVGNSSGVIATRGIQDLVRTTNFERTDVGLQLGIEAKAGLDGIVTLDLDLDVSSIALDQTLAGPVSEVGPTFVQQTIAATARLEDGETAIIAIDREGRLTEGEAGTPFLSRIPFVGWLFKRKIEEQLDTRLVVAAQARRVSSPAELVADTIRRRLVFERRSARVSKLPEADEDPFAVRVTTRTREDDAEAIAEGLKQRGFEASVFRWESRSGPLYDVYILSLSSMADAAKIAQDLGEEGWETDLVVLPSHS